jgi:imidazoleglycerol phosphate dehydratase HisB
MFRETRTKVRDLSKERVELERFSKNFRVKVTIDFSKTPESVGSGLEFVDSVLKNTNFSVEISKEGFGDREMVENVGFAFGEGLRKLHEKRGKKPLASYIRSDSERMCMFAIRTSGKFGEANIQIIGKPEFEPEQFFAFFDGFSQGFGMEVNAVINLGKEKSHMEFVSKAFGESLEQLFG